MTATLVEGRPSGPSIEPEGSELVPGYRVIAHLSRARRLDVYDAWSDERDSRCVIKTLRPDRTADRRAAAALAREGRLLSRLTHPHLVRAYEVARTSDGSRPAVVLETLGGETVSHLVHRLAADGHHLDPVEVAMLGQQLASVLTYLHRHGWLHLDLKPSNIIVNGGSARLIDLSIARRPGRALAGTGTLDYLAPEQAVGGHLTAAADVWGLGAVLFAVLVGAPPYGYLGGASGASGTVMSKGPVGSTGGDTGSEPTWTATSAAEGRDVTYPQLMSDPPPVGARGRVPVPLARVVDACLRRDPAARPAVHEVAGRLRAWLATFELEAAAP